MSTFRLEFALLAGLIAIGCGDDTQPAVDARQDAPVDAPTDAPGDGSSDAIPPHTCDPAAIVDLDPIATTNGGVKEAYFRGDTTGAARELEPSCSNGPGGGPERAHHFTAPSAARVRLTASTDETDTAANYDTVVYVRTMCGNAASEIACNDDDDRPGPRPLASRASVEIAGGTELAVIVDGYDEFAFGAYGLRVRAVPALPGGSTCDPTGTTNACQMGNICTSAGGPPPHCAPGTAPVLSQAVAQLMQNGRTVRVIVSGSDVDGDAVAAHLDFLDSSGAVITTAERGLGSAASGQTSFGPLVVYTQDGFVDRFPSVTRARVSLIDAAALQSSTMTATIVAIPVRELSQSCDAAGLTDECRGELVCTSGQCAVTAAAQAACSAAPTVADTMTLADTLNPLAGNFESSCAFSRGLDDRVYRVVLARQSDLIVTTDVMPSGAALDTAVYLRTSCTDPATQLACNDNIDASNAHSRVTVMDLAAGTYFAYVDGSRNGAGFVASGTVGVAIEIIPVAGPGEPCGTTIDGGVPVGRCASGLSCMNGTCQ